MLSEKFLNETKNHNPPFKLNGRSLIYFKDAKIFRCNYYTNINMSSNNKYIRLKNMYNKCTKNLYLVNVAFDKILDNISRSNE